MGDYLRYTRPGAANPQRSRMPSFVAGLDDLDEETDGFAVAPPNLSGRMERDLAPEQDTPNEEGGQRFQLRQPGMIEGLTDLPDEPRAGGDLRLPGDLAAPQQQLRTPMQGKSRLAFVQGLEESPEAQEPMPQMPSAKTLGSIDPTVSQRASEDAADRAASERARRARIGISIAGAIGGIFGNTTQAQVAQAAAANDPQAPYAARQASRAAEAQAQAEAAQQQYERDYAQQRLELEGRRIAQAEGATSQDQDRSAAMYDPNHPAAQSARIAYARLYRAIPPQALGQLAAFAPDEAMRGMSAMDLRQQANSLTQAWGRLQQANPRLFRVGTARVGGRTARGGLAGLSGGGGRTVDYGVSEGLTPDDFAALGIDPTSWGGEALPEGGDMPIEAQQAPAQGAPLARTAPRQGAGGQRPQAGAQAPGAAIPPEWVQPGAQAPQGVMLRDRPMTREELANATPEMRRTQVLIQSQMRRAIGQSWQDAAAIVNGLGDTARDRLVEEYGNENATRIPGWQRVRDTGTLPPAQMTDAREAVTQANQIRANSRRIQEIVRQVSALDLAEDEFRGHPLVTEWRSLSRRIQTALRVIDRTGVPTGTEQERAMQEASEPDSVQALMRASTVYSTLPDAISRQLWQYMDTLGYRPEGRRPQGGQ